MPLSELQQKLVALSSSSATSPTTISDNTSAIFGGKLGSTAHRIYRNNRLQALRQSLKQHYPTISLLLGELYFDHLSAEFIQQHPPRQRDMNSYGAAFPNWLESQLPLKQELTDLPYLADSARLDHLCHSSYYAPNRQAWPAEQFAALSSDKQAADKQAAVCLCLAEDIFPLHTQWPVDNIKNCSENSQPLDLSHKQDNYYFLIHRPQYQPQISAISESEFSLANALLQNTSLQQLLQDSEGQPPMHQYIFSWIECGWIDRFQIPGDAC
ncbi:hypothetical protein R50073_10970 [Maricurvus nonylphenolicus]|uniref:HvfC/BufC family peptide modification chaperone n=1 Tax=Maricurvus nonylphenolicus TaxID=1008307 RepID=UPI0036F3A893